MIMNVNGVFNLGCSGKNPEKYELFTLFHLSHISNILKKIELKEYML